jgi:hypothetical protein
MVLAVRPRAATSASSLTIIGIKNVVIESMRAVSKPRRQEPADDGDGEYGDDRDGRPARQAAAHQAVAGRRPATGCHTRDNDRPAF